MLDKNFKPSSSHRTAGTKQRIIMSFSFGFSATDFSDDDFDGETQQSPSIIASTDASPHPLDAPHLLDKSAIQPQWENLEAMIKSLENVRISFEEFETPQKKTILYRRELFDVKHQLMSEADEAQDEKVELDILIGETSEDLRKNVYEGGLKSWECSIDVVDSLSASDDPLKDVNCILELGCGTALPSEYIFSRYLKEGSRSGCKFILSDYNSSVLRLVTIPNLIITWAKHILNEEEWVQLQQTGDENIPIRPDELLLTSKFLEAFYQDLQAKNISIHLLSGTWGRSFSNLIPARLSASDGALIITSETIYQPENLPVVAETVLDLMLSKKLGTVKALVAAKDIYFGVGGSIMDFEKYLKERIETDSLPLNYSTYKIDSGLKRSIIFIK